MKRLVALAAVFIAGAAAAQEHHKHAPYAGMQQRAVKALSDQQVMDLRHGRGMGLALAAELNGYPGPMHVLELADQLRLSDGQRQQVQGLFEAMKAEAIAVGQTLIDQETVLDRLFAHKQATPASLAQATGEIAQTQGRLREVHLKYHLKMAELLSPAQMQKYAELRGYR
jgi:hypothetical protein